MFNFTRKTDRPQRNLPRAGWFIGGVVVTAVLAPAAAYAVLAFTGIQGTQGSGTTLYKAAVSNTHHLQVSEAYPANFYSKYVEFGASKTLLAIPPTGTALIIKTIHATWASNTSYQDYLLFYINKFKVGGLTAGACSTVGRRIDSIEFSTTSGAQPLAYEPGFSVRQGEVLCVVTGNSVGSASVFGYTVPMADIP